MTILRRSLIISAAALFAGTSLAQSPRSADAPPPRPPLPVETQPAPVAPDMDAVIMQMIALGAKPLETLTPAQARVQPSAADGAKAVMRQRGMPTEPDPSVTTRDLPYGSDRQQFARIYKPAAAANATNLPVVVYYHGGGWVIATVDTYDATPRLLAQQLNAVVVSVEYRHAPEAKFPAQHDDAAAAYRWVLQNAREWGGDPSKIALAGESAGGTWRSPPPSTRATTTSPRRATSCRCTRSPTAA